MVAGCRNAPRGYYDDRGHLNRGRFIPKIEKMERIDKELAARAAELAKKSASDYFFGSMDDVSYFKQVLGGMREALEDINTAPVDGVADVIKLAASGDANVDEKTRRSLYDVAGIALLLIKHRDELGVLGSWIADLDDALIQPKNNQKTSNKK